MPLRSDTERDIHIIIPLYKNADLVAPLFNSLVACESELRELRCTVVAINDSPEDEKLASELASAVRRLSATVQCSVTTNLLNQGFLKTVNAACENAIEVGADVVLLNSDTVVFPGAFREMRHVAYADSMIGFVSPRSNNATICTFPQQKDFENLPPQQHFEVFKTVAKYLPRFHYVPTAVGFCLFIKFEILNEFGVLDPAYGAGYSEENDLIMRANRCGYRAALANHGFVYHIGEKSFSVSGTPKAIHEERNFALLDSRYPEYISNVRAYSNGVHFESERLLAGLIPDSSGRIDLVFDCSHFGARHNGTFIAASRFIQQAAVSWADKFNIHVLANPAIAQFHGFTSMAGVLVAPLGGTRVFGIALRFGQPFDYDAVVRLSRLAPINIFAMLDTIAWDCLYLNGGGDLDDIWRTVARYSDGLLYISQFNCDQFRLRFPVRPGMAETASYLSLRPGDYVLERKGDKAVEKRAGSYLLVIGNSFAHKYVEPTVRSMAKHLPRTKVVALGLNGSVGQNITSYSSGQLDAAEVGSLFEGARAIIFPSTYEGFGIPLMEALSHRKPVFARDNSLNRDIHKQLGYTRNIVLYDSTKTLIRLLAESQEREWVDDLCQDREFHSWKSHAKEVEGLLAATLGNFSYEHTLRPRLDFIRALERDGLSKLSVTAAADVPLPDDAKSAFVSRYEFPSAAKMESNAEVLKILEDHSRQSMEIDVRLADIESLFKTRDGRVSDLEGVLRDREARMHDVLGSWSWKLTAPLRGVGSAWLKLFGK